MLYMICLLHLKITGLWVSIVSLKFITSAFATTMNVVLIWFDLIPEDFTYVVSTVNDEDVDCRHSCVQLWKSKALILFGRLIRSFRALNDLYKVGLWVSVVSLNCITSVFASVCSATMIWSHINYLIKLCSELVLHWMCWMSLHGISYQKAIFRQHVLELVSFEMLFIMFVLHWVGIERVYENIIYRDKVEQ